MLAVFVGIEQACPLTGQPNSGKFNSTNIATHQSSMNSSINVAELREKLHLNLNLKEAANVRGSMIMYGYLF